MRASITALSASVRASLEEFLALLLEVLLQDFLLPCLDFGCLCLGILDDLLGLGMRLGQKVFCPGLDFFCDVGLLFSAQLGSLFPRLLEDGFRLGPGLGDHLLAFLLEVLDQGLFLPGFQLRRLCLGILDDLLGLGLRLGERSLCLWLDLLGFCFSVLEDLFGLGLRVREDLLCLWLDRLGFCLGVLEDLLGLGVRLGKDFLRLWLRVFYEGSLLFFQCGGLLPRLLEDGFRLGLGSFDFLQRRLHLFGGEAFGLLAGRFHDLLGPGLGVGHDIVCLLLGGLVARRGPHGACLGPRLFQDLLGPGLRLGHDLCRPRSGIPRGSGPPARPSSSWLSRTISSALAFAWATVLL